MNAPQMNAVCTPATWALTGFTPAAVALMVPVVMRVDEQGSARSTADLLQSVHDRGPVGVEPLGERPEG